MARRLAVASRSRFELLQQDDLEHSESDDDAYVQPDPTLAQPMAALRNPLATLTPDEKPPVLGAELKVDNASFDEGVGLLQDALKQAEMPLSGAADVQSRHGSHRTRTEDAAGSKKAHAPNA
ncbi:hypothetical protein QFC19_006304 [Naganishia cerealis]|uniref:Uncharacterized protein n=1 Tax=Naganishia cerealis TaxID=610337 RepID=A0ACC2VIA0_9TREE|nr:hypothetical protein QFC19_006304 [Naganishia cerealis]